MASSYIAIEFLASGPQDFADKVAAIDAVPATELIFRSSRELAWYERRALFSEELACRVIVWVQDVVDVNEVVARPQDADPYRKLTIYDVEYEVPRELAELIEDYAGECSIVERGHLRFTTRSYEAELLDRLVVDLEREAGSQARAEFGVEGRRLLGRIEGAIPMVHELEQLVKRSGLVDWDGIIVGYS